MQTDRVEPMKIQLMFREEGRKLMGILKIFNRKNNDDFTERVSIEENTDAFICNFELLVEKADVETIKKMIKFIADSIQGQLISKCFYNDRNYGMFIRNVKNSILIDLPNENYAKCNERIDIATTPIISCVWNETRLVSAMSNINKFVGNPFDGIKNSQNIIAYMVKPINLVIVVNGNHSVNSAIVHGEGQLVVNEVIDIKPLLKKYRFTGKKYVDIITNKPINYKLLKNKSEPFVYELGLLFEIARILDKKGICLEI